MQPKGYSASKDLLCSLKICMTDFSENLPVVVWVSQESRDVFIANIFLRLKWKLNPSYWCKIAL